MPFDKYPYAKRPVLEVVIMDYVMPVFIVICLIIGIVGLFLLLTQST